MAFLRRFIVLPIIIGTWPAHAGVQDVAQLYYARLVRHRAAEETPGRRSSIASLTRVIDDAYFADVAREEDPDRRLSLLLDLVGRRALNSDDSNERIEQYYAHLGSVREDLLAIAQSKSFAAVDDDNGGSPAQRAKNLLIYWFDPADESLIRQWAKEDAFKHFRLDIECSGDSPDEALSAYAEAHFAREPKTSHYFTNAAFSPDGNHQYVVFTVRYAHWGYWQPIVLLREGDQWKVKLAGEGGRWHSRP